MKPTTLAIVVGACGLAGLVLYLRSSSEDDSTDDGTGGDDVTGGNLVFHRERADGVDDRLQAFLDYWDANGPFPITIPANGGIRTDATQAGLFAQGRSTPGPNAGMAGHSSLGDKVTNASTASTTAHGHAGALDIYPAVLNASGTAVASVRTGGQGTADWALFQTIGRLAKAHGLRWGGDFSSPVDGPHVEVPDWQSLPIAGLGNA